MQIPADEAKTHRHCRSTEGDRPRARRHPAREAEAVFEREGIGRRVTAQSQLLRVRNERLGHHSAHTQL